jgi:hypothetical protein
MPQAVQGAAAAIVALINASPRSPRQDEIEAILARTCAAPAQEMPISDLRIRLRKAMAMSNAALQVAARLQMGAEFDLADAARSQWEDEIAGIEAEIPNPPRCFEDLVARAEIARHDGDVVDGNVFVGPAGRLVEAVLQIAGKGVRS